ncbi:MAG: ABC transporter ATP-binding protein [Candidatus Dormibacteraceae bacterium]
MSDLILQVEHIGKVFPVSRDLLGRGTHWLSALEDVNFTLERGHALGIVGESGSGKSTLARLLVGLQRPTTGRILLNGRDVSERPRTWTSEVRRRVQIIFQDPYSSLDPRMRLLEIVTEGMWHSRLGTRQKHERAYELLEQVGLSRSVGSNFPHQLSGGQRQRVGIARALAANPDVLIADEPVSALDVSIQGQILNLLRRLQREHNLSLLFITHDLAVARHMSDSIAVMHMGKVVESAPTEELFLNPLHPYTQALLSASLVFGRPRAARIVLQGDLASPVDPPKACRFASRCFRRIDRCVKEDPGLEPVAVGDHLVACFNWAALGKESDAASRAG